MLHQGVLEKLTIDFLSGGEAGAQVLDLRIIDSPRRKAQCRRLENGTQGQLLAHRLGRERPRDPVRTLVLADEPTLMQAAEHVAHHRAAHPQMVAQLGFNDAELAEDQAGGDFRLDPVIDEFPCTAALQGLVDLAGDLQVECADVLAERLHATAPGTHQKAAPGEAVNEVFRLQNAQRRLNGRAA